MTTTVPNIPFFCWAGWTEGGIGTATGTAPDGYIAGAAAMGGTGGAGGSGEGAEAAAGVVAP